jgi:class 3 adenylate cyclase/predicted ATPase
MYNLIPDFIQTQFERGYRSGTCEALTMFVDISGFTAMTESLMRGGDDGAEILSGILNRLFNPIVAAIHTYGGFISTFAGDAFTAVFMIEEATDGDQDDRALLTRQCLACAQEIQAIFQTQRLQRTRYGDFTLSVKVGLGYGEVEWGIGGCESLVDHPSKAYFFRGPAIDACALAEHQAQAGDIIATIDMLAPLPLDRLAEHFDDPFISQEVKRDDVERSPESYRRLTKAWPSPAPRPVTPPLPTPKRETLLKFLPQAVVDFNQTGEFRHVVSLFISFAGLGSLSELDTFAGILLNHAQRFAGYLNKVDFGDKGGIVLYLFGAPVTYENNIARALDCILALRQEFRDAPNLSTLQWRAGLSYGTVYAGIIGGDRRCEYTAIGDRVNLAARLMMKAAFDEIWVSEEIDRSARQNYDLSHHGNYRFKGKADELPVYRLKGKRSAVQRLFTGEFIGRQRELELAQQSFAPLSQNQCGGVLYIYGDVGVGKSRLAYELQQRHLDLYWSYMPCDNVLRKSFNPFHHFFSRFFGQSPDMGTNPQATRAQNRANFELLYQALINSLPGQAVHRQVDSIRQELTRLQSIMAGFLGLQQADSLYEQLDPRLRYQNTLYVFAEVFKALSLRQPVVLEVEDFQWIDPDSTQALETLCQELDGFPFLLLITSRYTTPDRKPRLEVDMPMRAIDLNNFPTDNASALIADHLEGKPTPHLVDYLLSKTQGNPLFLEQTLDYFKESGIIAATSLPDTDQADVEIGECWDIVREEAMIPDTLADLLIARVDHLADQTKETVQTAAILGQEFETRLLSTMLQSLQEGFTPAEVQTCIQAGVEERIWVMLAEPTYVFAHSLLRDAVYQMQLRSRLRRLHRAAAQAISQLHPDDPRLYSDLAFHCENAEIMDKAISHYHQAGDYAQDTYAVALAITYYQKALSLLDTITHTPDSPWTQAHIDQQRLELYQKLGLMLRWQTRFEEAVQVYRTMLTLAEATDVPLAQARAWEGLSHAQEDQGAYQDALASIENAEDLIRAEGAAAYEPLAELLCYKGYLFSDLGDPKTALTLAEQALALSSEVDNRYLMAQSLTLIGWTRRALGHYELAAEYMEQALHLFEELKNRNKIAGTLNDLGANASDRGDFQTAKQLFEEALASAREIGHRYAEIIVLNNLGAAQVGLGDYEAAEANLEQSLSMAKRVGWGGRSDTSRLLAEAYLGQGKTAAALVAARSALILGQGSGAQEDIAGAWRTLGHILAHPRTSDALHIQEETVDAPMCFERSLDIYTETKMAGERARTLHAWGEYEQAHGDSTRGAAMHQEAHTIFEELGMETID